MFNLKTIATGAAALALMASSALAQTVIRVQSVIPAQADEVFMLQDFAN
ncbi:MAG: C4-dicarboxylate ABC transporter substrate-binding protein, partial [Silicimonas sp.]|nr:C4-dicarboxylate ABC transporter substrate-binding protein [Silicimonas sp.]